MLLNIYLFQVMVERKRDSDHHPESLIKSLCHLLYINRIKILCEKSLIFY